MGIFYHIERFGNKFLTVRFFRHPLWLLICIHNLFIPPLSAQLLFIIRTLLRYKFSLEKYYKNYCSSSVSCHTGSRIMWGSGSLRKNSILHNYSNPGKNASKSLLLPSLHHCFLDHRKRISILVSFLFLLPVLHYFRSLPPHSWSPSR